MRIAFIGQKGIPAKIGGVERYVDEVAVRMAKRGHNVFVYVRNHYTLKRLKNYKGVRLIHLPTIKTKHLDAITHTFLATIHSLFQNYDVIHYHSLGPTSLSFFPKIFCRKTAVITTYQTQDYYHAKWGLLARLYLRFGEIITLYVPDKVIAVSDILRNYGLEIYGKDSIIIPNGVTLFKKTRPLSVFRKWNLEKRKYFLAVSRLVEHKEIHTLIKAFAALKTTKKIRSDWKLVIAGGGSYTDRYVREIKAMTRGRKDIILAGVQKGEKLAALYKNAYAFVQPSRSEGLSLALLEAMGAGLAPLVSDIPENLSAIHPVPIPASISAKSIGESEAAAPYDNSKFGFCGKDWCGVQGAGFVFRTGDIFDLMSKVEYLINNSTKVRKAGKEAKEIVRDYYNWDKIVTEIEGVYSEALDEKMSRKFGREMSFLRKTRII